MMAKFVIMSKQMRQQNACGRCMMKSRISLNSGLQCSYSLASYRYTDDNSAVEVCGHPPT